MWDHHNLVSKPLPLREASGRFATPAEIAGDIRNMVLTEAGTLRAVVGPCEYHPTSYQDNGGSGPGSTTYDTPHSGIFHHRVEGGKRDILLAHFDGHIWVHEGWGPRWKKLISPDTVLGVPLGDYAYEFQEDDGRVSFGTQFVGTPNGIVILPQGGAPLFYDGTFVDQLGFSTPPAPPTPMYPRRLQTADGTDDIEDLANKGGYAHSGRTMAESMGDSRIGTIRSDVLDVTDSGRKSNALGGVLLEGEWRAALQFEDRWGNRSPISARSGPAYVHKQDNLTKERVKQKDESASRLKLQLAWADLDKGPDHVQVRHLLRTRDQKSSGIPGLFYVPPNATSDSQTRATIPNVVQDMYPDNIPDTWLIEQGVDYAPMQQFRLAALAFGRMWYANTPESPGLLRPSEPLFWGTLPLNMEIFPDATGAEITGLLPCNSGLLVFTDSSTFLITQDDTGQNYKTATLSTTAGCVAPKSARVMLNGAAVWLGHDGFYGWAGEGMPVPLTRGIQDTHVHRINQAWARQSCAAVDYTVGEYRCWVPWDGSQRNEMCFVYDGSGWKFRNDVYAQDVCVTSDHRRYMLVLGHEPSNVANSVWVLDHEAQGPNASPTSRESYIETSWLRATRSHRPASIVRSTLWLRETSSSALDVKVMRDYREYPKMDAVGEEPDLHPSNDIPDFWDAVTLAATKDDELRAITNQDDGLVVHFQRRRPFWTEVDMEVPSASSFKLRLSAQGDWEFQAFIFDEQDRHAGGATNSQGSST